MQITLKLFASLSEFLPVGHQNHQVALEVEEGTTVQDLLHKYQLPPKLVHLVLVNGSYVDPDKRATRTLLGGDVLAIWPPVAGG